MKRTIRITTGMFMVFATAAFGSTGTSDQGGWLWTLFIGFGALLLVFQLIPAVTLFCSMLKGLFSVTSRKTALAETAEPDRKDS